MKNMKRKMAALLAVMLAMTSMPVAAAENVAAVGTETDAAAGEAQIITASGQLAGDKPEETEARSAGEIIEALYARVTEDDLAELVGRAEDAFAETEAPESATDAEEYKRMLSLVRKEAEAYLEKVLETAKEEYTELEQEDVYRAVFSGLCEKMMDAVKELYGMEEPSVMSLQPLEEKWIYPDLKGLTPLELTMVPFSAIFEGVDMEGAQKVAYVYHYNHTETSENYSDDYVVGDYSGYANLCYGTSDVYRFYLDEDQISEYSAGCYGRINHPWLMIPSGEQLDSNAKRYVVEPEVTVSWEWLAPTVYWQNDAGARVEMDVASYRYYDQNERYITISVEDAKMPSGQQVYIKLDLNTEVYGSFRNIAEIKVYEGSYMTAEAAMKGTEITDQIYGNIDMTQADAGYVMDTMDTDNSGKEITMVAFDGNGNVTGCLPFSLKVYRTGTARNYGEVRANGIFKKTVISEGTDAKERLKRDRVYSRSILPENENGPQTQTFELYKEYASNGKYFVTLDYYPKGSANSINNAAVTAAYAGVYESIAAAESAGAEDIKKALFGLENDIKKVGYEADYSNGVTFTVFVGKDGEGQEIIHYTVRAKDGALSQNSLSGGTDVIFYGLRNKDGYVSCYVVQHKDDSYAEGNYPTIVVRGNVDLTELAPEFYCKTDGIKLYAERSSTPEESGKSYHDFSDGPVHYTTSSENGKNQKNVWLTVIRENSGEESKGKKYDLYTNSLSDDEAGTRVEDGVIYSKREIVLGDIGDAHDIFLINMGADIIPKLSVELESDMLEIDEYWTLDGNHDLSEFSGVVDTTNYGELANMAKVRLKRKEGTEDGAEIGGILRIKADGELIMVLELTGIVGVPVIVTDTIPEAVKYVPYGTMIQNSNKYRKTRVVYQVFTGVLPEGMELRENGELYGVPLEAGTFEFEVQMRSANPDGQSKQKLTLVVKENTDENVNAATDAGYDVTQRIPTVAIGSVDIHDFVSQGILNEFVDVFLDGEKLVRDVDYTAESGSTRLTISSQTLTRSNQTGTHTLGVEFRTGEEKVLKAAAQNFNVVGASNSSSSGSSSSGSSSSGSSSSDGGGSDGGSSEDNSSGSTSGNSAQFTANTNAAQGTAGTEAVRTEIYTIEPGDTLTKIAVKYYGSASLWRKIYEDNRDVIANPNRIRAGMKIKLYLANVTAGTAEAGTAAAASTGQYTIRGGDSLWKIARTMYGQGGQWRRIYEANRSVIPESLILRVGQVITIP